MIEFLELPDVLAIHEKGILDFGGAHGVRDKDRLDSAINMPRSGFGGEYFHKTIPSMAAAYAFHICQTHPFLDGNKRTALTSSVVFLKANGYELTCNNETAYSKIIGVASGKISKEELIGFYEELAVQAVNPTFFPKQ